jgi:hypothetical protein
VFDRFDVTGALEDTRKIFGSNGLSHHVTGANLLEVLRNGGVLASTERRRRVGVTKSKGMSERADMKTGGARRRRGAHPLTSAATAHCPMTPAGVQAASLTILSGVPQPGGDHVVVNEDLTAEDRSALGWALSTEHLLGVAVAERVRSGGSGVTAGELAAIRREWEQAGRPVPERHVHRSTVVFEDGTTIIAVTFVAADPYSREAVPSFGLYLDERWAPPWLHDHLGLARLRCTDGRGGATDRAPRSP